MYAGMRPSTPRARTERIVRLEMPAVWRAGRASSSLKGPSRRLDIIGSLVRMDLVDRGVARALRIV